MTPEDIVAIARPLLGRHSDVENFGVIGFDSALNTKGRAILFRGGYDSVNVDIRVLFRWLISHRATRFAVFHNHPSGITEPSDEDILLTRTIASAGGFMGVELIDHIILGDGGATTLYRMRPDVWESPATTTTIRSCK